MQNKRIDILLHGGKGDMLLATPSLRALKQEFPHTRLRVFYIKGNEQVLLHNPNIDVLTRATFWAAPLQWTRFRLGKHKIRESNYISLMPTLVYNKSAVDIIADLLRARLKDRKMDYVVTDEEMSRAEASLKPYPNPIVFCVSTAQIFNKEWFHDKWEMLIGSIPEVPFIQIGGSEDPVVKGAMNMLGKSLRDSVALITHASCYVGVDSFFAHAATAVGTPAVVLFGATPPSVFGHEGNENLYRKRHCSPCYETLRRVQCPYGKKCMEEITVEDVKQSIVKIRRMPVQTGENH